MESNQEQKRISSENHQRQSGRSSSKKSKNRHRSKKQHQSLSATASSEHQHKEQKAPQGENASGVSQSAEKQKNDAKEKQHLQHDKTVSQHGDSAKASSQGQTSEPQKGEEKAKPADVKKEKEETRENQAPENQGNRPKSDDKKEEKKSKESSEKKEDTGKSDKKGEEKPVQAQKPNESVKKEETKKDKSKESVPGRKEQKKEKAPKKQRKRHGITFYVVIFTFFVVIGSAAMMASLFLSSNNAFFANIPEVELPVFTKMNVDDILENPEYGNFRFRIEEIYSNEVEEGIVTDQSPKPPKSVKENAVITLKVSKGPESVTVPSVVGWNRDTAREKFKDLGLSVLIQSESDRNVAPNKVIRTNPEAGTVVQAGDVITLYVSRSISETTIVTIPNCVGLTQDSAKSQLSRMGLVGLTVIKDGSEPAGTVIGQSPSGGTKTGANDTVQLYVSNGKLTGTAGVVGGVPAQEGQQLYPGGPMVGNADGQVVPGSVTGHIHTWQIISGTGNQVCTVCGQTR